MFLPITETNRVPVDSQGAPVLVAEPTGPILVEVGTFQAFSMSEEQAKVLGTLRDATFFADHPEILKAIHLVRNRRELRFDPRTGRELEYPAPGVVGRDAHNGHRIVFPRLDPAVIGIIHLAGTDKILLAKNRMRNSFYSLIAGYVDAGETLEEAFTREALEETGMRVREVRYWGSQPWPTSGSLMVGAHGVSLGALAIATVSQAVAPCKAQGVLSISHAPLSNALHKYGAWNLLDNKINL